MLNEFPCVLGDVGLAWCGGVAILVVEFCFGDGVKDVFVEDVKMGVDVG